MAGSGHVAPLGRSTKKGGALFGAVVGVNTVDVEQMVMSVMRAVGPESMVLFGGKVSNYLTDKERIRFDVEGDIESGFWAPLAPATERIRASLGFDPVDPINIRTERMYDVVPESKSVDPLPGGVQVTSPNVGSLDPITLKKYMTAQFGDTDNRMIPGAVTPPRPVVAIGERDLVNIMALLQIHIMGQAVNSIAAGAF